MGNAVKNSGVRGGDVEQASVYFEGMCFVSGAVVRGSNHFKVFMSEIKTCDCRGYVYAAQCSASDRGGFCSFSANSASISFRYSMNSAR